MNKQSISFKADEQKLTKTGGIEHYASNIVAYIEATFDLGTNWNGYDSVRAVWSNDYLTDISTVLDSNGKCIVPTEVLTDTGNVTVNLVGSIADGDTLTDRLTTYPCKAVIVDADAKVEGDETESITPSQFEQFVEIVHDEVEQVTGMSAEAETLPAGSDATASYSDGVLSLGIPKGADGVDGQDGVTPDIDIGTVETLETGVPAYANITGTVENPSLNLGLPKGNTGDTGATGAPAGFGAVTATIDGTTGTPSVDVTASGADTAKNFAFAFHNLKGEQGEQGEQGDPGVVQDVTVNGTSVVDQNGVAVIKVPELVKTVQGNPIVIDDAFGEVKNLDVELTPIQEGSGTPSPQNVRPITGHDSVTVGDTGVNQWDEQWKLGYYRNGIFVSGTTVCSNDKIKVPTNSNIYLVKESAGIFYYTFYDVNGDFLPLSGYDNLGRFATYSSGVIAVPSGAYYMTFNMASSYGSTYLNDISINYPSTITSKETYKEPVSKTVTLPHTVYGAGVGVTSGEGKETWANIPSYNGETISEPWLSSMDEYVQGATPTTGAQVTYKLATPTDLSTTPTSLTLYNGDNVISSDGDMELTYVQDMAIVIRKIESQL